MGVVNGSGQQATNHGKTNEMKVKQTRDGRRDKTYQPCGDLHAAPAAALRALRPHVAADYGGPMMQGESSSE
jgi:hypothetical protein